MEKILCNYILLILSCEKYRYKATMQKESWLKKLNIKFYHIIGNPNLNTNYHFDEFNNYLYVKTKDDYNSLPSKIINALEAINEKYNYKYIFKTDDDQQLMKEDFFTIVIKTLIQNELNNKKSNYGGNPIPIYSHISDYYKVHPCLPDNIIIEETIFCNGRFYLLSKETVEYLIKKKEKISRRYLEDHTIGFYIPEYLKNNMPAINDVDSIFNDM